MTNIDIVQTSFPEYIWIVNDQQLVINKKNLNNFQVNETLILGGDRKRVYNLKGIVFKENYKYNCWLKLYHQTENSDEWFSFDGDKWVNMLDRVNDKLGKSILFSYNKQEGLRSRWPIIFLYKKVNIVSF